MHKTISVYMYTVISSASLPLLTVADSEKFRSSYSYSVCKDMRDSVVRARTFPEFNAFSLFSIKKTYILHNVGVYAIQYM